MQAFLSYGLTVPTYGWRHHPAVKMWRGHEETLAAPAQGPRARRPVFADVPDDLLPYVSTAPAMSG